MASIREDELLILEVKKHACLYDNKDHMFQDQNVKCATWKAIAAKLGMSEEHVKKRWFNIRHCFRRYRKESRIMQTCTILETMRDSTPRLRRKYRYADLLEFLVPHLFWQRNLHSASETDYSDEDGPIILDDDDEYVKEEETMADQTTPDAGGRFELSTYASEAFPTAATVSVNPPSPTFNPTSTSRLASTSYLPSSPRAWNSASTSECRGATTSNPASNSHSSSTSRLHSTSYFPSASSASSSASTSERRGATKRKSPLEEGWLPNQPDDDIYPSAPNDEELDLFFKSIACTLRKLPQRAQAEAKFKIYQLVYQAEMDHL